MRRLTAYDYFDVVQWLQQLARCGMSGTGWSNLRKEQSCDMALRAAIHGGAKFPRDAFIKGGVWHPEWVYALACEVNNRSACLALEKYLGRPALIWDGQRMHEGFQFWHEGMHRHWRINSFGKDHQGWYANAVNITHIEKQETIRHMNLDEKEPKNELPKGERRRMRFYHAELVERERQRLAAKKPKVAG